MRNREVAVKMLKFLVAMFLIQAMFVLTVAPVLAEEMSPAKRKLLEKAKKDSAAAKAVIQSESSQSMLDLNKASKLQLMDLPGIGEAEADKIIAGRPYLTKMELKKKEIIPLDTFYGIIDKVEVVVEIKRYEPPVPGKAPQPAKSEAKDKPKRDMKDLFK